MRACLIHLISGRLLVLIFVTVITFSCSNFDDRNPLSEEFNDPQLEIELQELLKDFKGEVGLYVRNLKSGQSVSVNADELFPTASMIKVPILLALFNKNRIRPTQL